MPYRPFERDQSWLFPPSLEELLPATHPARFVAAFVEALDPEDWRELGLALTSPGDGAPSYHPRGLVSVWLYGFLTGVRTTRKLERACQESIPFLWLSGLQQPDHNTLWRFYERHRERMQILLKRTVRIAVGAGLIDLALQAVDGTKIAGNAAKDRTFDAAGLAQLDRRIDDAIAVLESRNAAGDEPDPPELPEALAAPKALRAKVHAAMEQLRAEDGPKRINLTDPEATLMKGRQGFVAGYNAQAMVVATERDQATGATMRLITATAVTTDPDDHSSLLPMLEAAEAMLGTRPTLSLADGGYHSADNLTDCAQRNQIVLMPESQAKQVNEPYHKAQFVSDPTQDTYTCPEGQTLRFRYQTLREGRAPKRVYGAQGKICRACPAFGLCTKNRNGRRLETVSDEPSLVAQRERMRTAAAKAGYRHRKELVELVFGLIKDQQGGRRLWLRGLAKVQAEWTCLAVGFNLKTLARAWARRTGMAQQALVGLPAA